MTKQIYIVMGQTGQYDSVQEWPVVAYLEEDLAKKHCALAANWFHNAIGGVKNVSNWDRLREVRLSPRKLNPYDEYMLVDYGGVFWDVMEVKLEENLPNE